MKFNFFKRSIKYVYKLKSRGIAQPGSASGLGPEGRKFKSCCPDQNNKNMKKAKIYIPSKTATQSGRNNSKKWVLEFIKDNSNYDHLMNWESTTDTQSQVKLYFDDKDSAINYAKK